MWLELWYKLCCRFLKMLKLIFPVLEHELLLTYTSMSHSLFLFSPILMLFFSYNRLGRQCELDPPYLRIQNAWGNPHNEVGKHLKNKNIMFITIHYQRCILSLSTVTCESWKKLKKISAQEGLIAIAYERNFGALYMYIV